MSNTTIIFMIALMAYIFFFIRFLKRYKKIKAKELENPKKQDPYIAPKKTLPRKLKNPHYAKVPRYPTFFSMRRIMKYKP